MSSARGFDRRISTAVAIIGTLFDTRIEAWGYVWIVVGLVIGSVIGGTMGLQIPMTAVPQRTALSHSLGALAAMLVDVKALQVPVKAAKVHTDAIHALENAQLALSVLFANLR